MSFKKFRASGVDKAVTVEEQQIKITEVRKLMGPLVNKMPSLCSDVSISRYLRARNWSTKKASKMLKETIKWRLEYKPETIRWEDIAHEAETGKIYRTNYLDKFGRTVLVMRPGFQNTSSTKGQIKYLVYCMENAIFNLAAGQEEMVWLIDFQGWSTSSISMNVTRETAHVLQDHYPERLGLGILYNPPKIFESFAMMVKPFLELKTYKKLKFVYSDNNNNNDSQMIMQQVFDMDKLESAFGGRNSMAFNYKVYERRMKEDDEKMSNLLKSGESVLLQQLYVSAIFQRSKSSISAPLSESSDEASRCSDFTSPELEETTTQSVNEERGQQSCNAISIAEPQANVIQMNESA